MASTIKVDNVQNQPGTNVVNKCGTTVNIGAASDNIRSAGNNLQASDGGNLISQSGTDITLGASGDTINLASGASQTGFGRTGTVDWVTTPKVTGDSPVTAATGSGYFLNTTAGTITINLPAGAAGSIVSVMDYAATWDSNVVTVSPNGSEKIGGTNSNVALNTKGQSVTFVYVDSTQGWLNTMDSTSNVRGGTFITATVSGVGNTLTCSGNCKVAKFIAPGTFCVSAISLCAANNLVSYAVVAGGGGGGAGNGGSFASGGGGGGGFRELKSPSTPYTASPLDGYPNAPNRITVSATGYPIVVGGGGPGSSASGCTPGVSGGVSTFSTICSAGGGGGGAGQGPGSPGVAGGSGGGAGSAPGPLGGGAGNTPPVTPPQGFAGGDHPPSICQNAGSGGGATAVGADAVPGTGNPVAGGAGAVTCISATPTTYSTGGASGNWPSGPTTNGPDNSGIGGKGAGGCNPSYITGANGGSGIVIIRYRYQ